MFIILFTLAQAAGAWFFWRRTVAAAALPRPWRFGLALLFLGLTALVPVAVILSWTQPREQVLLWTLLAYLWVGLLWYGLLWGLSLWLPALALRLRRSGENRSKKESDFSRRTFLRRTTAGATALGATATAAVGWRGAWDWQVEEVVIPLAKLPPALDGFRLVQLSDLHVGPLYGEAFMKQVQDRVRQLRPDAIAITGDVIDGSVSRLRQDVAPLGGLKAPYGTFLVSGNHEYYSGIGPWLNHFRSLGLQVLANQHQTLGEPGAAFQIAGVHDYRGGAFGPEFAPDMEAALSGRDLDLACVLLAHQPAHVHQAGQLGVDLQLSGHTHGGQLWPFGYLTSLVQPYLQGTHHHGEQTWIHVNRGTGLWGPPMRVLAPPEITLVVLTSA
ncbi:MAG: metallophosphoesterase [Planctomycetota bacterium]|nr:MAG: metallophosphoesterase [Planctomycetota bacterium]